MLTYYRITAMLMYADTASCTLPLRSQTANHLIAVSSRDLQTSSADHWTSAFLSTAYGSPTAAAIHSVYSPDLPRHSSTMLPLDPLRRLTPSLHRFSHGRVAHPVPRQSAFTIHHGARCDLIPPGQTNHHLYHYHIASSSSSSEYL